MSDRTTHWILLVVTLPTSSATARMRIWRALKALGCGALRDGVYLLPDTAALRAQLAGLGEETIREGGAAWLLRAGPVDAADEQRYRSLFDRRQEYAAFIGVLAEAGKSIPASTPQDVNRQLRKLRRDYDALRTIDYFPDEASVQGEQAWQAFTALAAKVLSPDEPHAADVPIPRLDPAAYRARAWATRKHLWVDRVASAWLIRRHIDHDARFLWLDMPADCPPDALGFDFDGAAFSHVGDKVTFEVLLASFGLHRDPGLVRLGALVHVLDVGSGFVAEAAGFEAMLAGLRQHARDDDDQLAHVAPLLDGLYAHFSNRHPT
ncbi:MAG: chromate resistance protein ChrB domain-containing protein [Massilia sp.]